MTWASELFKKVIRANLVSDLEHEGYFKETDLFLAVLEKNKEIKTIYFDSTTGTHNQRKKRKQQRMARAFRELVKECQLLISTNNVKISNKLKEVRENE